MVLRLFILVLLLSVHASGIHVDNSIDSRGIIHHMGRHTLVRSSQMRREPASAPPKKPRVVYGVMTCNNPKKQQLLRAQAETWAADIIKEGRFFAVTSSSGALFEKSFSLNEEDGGMEVSQAPPTPDFVYKSSCSDNGSGISCKEAALLEMGLNHSADWVFRADDDCYVDTDALESALSKIDVQGPAVFGNLGCGQGQKGDLSTPMTPGQFVYPEVCPEATKLGGLCGGSGYALNRAALLTLLRGGWQELHQRYESIYNQGVKYGDIVTSCVLRERGVPLQELNGLGNGDRTLKLEAWQQMINSRVFTYHYATPDIMFWLHAKLEDAPGMEVKSLEDTAFKKGCCCWIDEKSKDQCQLGSLTSIRFMVAREAVYPSLLGQA